MKIIKICISSSELKKPSIALDKFENIVITTAKNKQKLDTDSYLGAASAITTELIKQNKADEAGKRIIRIAERLINLNNDELAAILYGFIIKMFKNIKPEFVETLAINALKIANRSHDPIHIMARANDLANLYKLTEKGSPKHLKALYTTKRALNDICTNYDGAMRRYKSNIRKMKPLDNYQYMLAAIKFEISEIIIKQEPKQAKIELEEAKELLLKCGKINNNLIKKIESLIAQIK